MIREFDIVIESSGDLCGTAIYDDINKELEIKIIPNQPDGPYPLEFRCLIEQGIYTMTGKTAINYIRDRAVPSSRQNIGQILRDNGLTKYDDFDVFMITTGRNDKDGCVWRERK